MLKKVAGFVGVIALGLFLVAGQRPAAQAGQAAQSGRGGGQGTTILEQAPKDHSIAIPKEKLAQYFKDMDAKKLSTLRMIEGGKYNVNIRRITNAETALVHPTTTDLWIVLDGGGTLTTGGVLESGKINGGESHPLTVGDVVYIPSGLPHGVSGVNGNITWLNVRWDTDWPADTPMGAGNLPGAAGRGGAGGGRRGGGAGEAGAPPAAAAAGEAGRAGAAGGGGRAAGAGGGRAGGGGTMVLQYGGQGEIFLPKEKIDAYMKDMLLKKSNNYRMIEGGRFNVNLRYQGVPSVEEHDNTIDCWYIWAGAATVNTGYDVTGTPAQRVPNTGVSVKAKPGDVFFIPSHFYHGFSTVDPDVFWLNIRWDDNYAAPAADAK
jgi:mannose-6-phosphate isomerase-like protein (cupin superfamily)